MEYFTNLYKASTQEHTQSQPENKMSNNQSLLNRTLENINQYLSMLSKPESILNIEKIMYQGNRAFIKKLGERSCTDAIKNMIKLDHAERALTGPQLTLMAKNYNLQQDESYNRIIDSIQEHNFESKINKQIISNWYQYIHKLGLEKYNQDGALCELNDKKLLQELSKVKQQLRNIIPPPSNTDAKPNPNLELKTITLKLQYLAILRESMYRSTGMYPNHTQMLVILAKIINNQKFIAEVPTGQGKTLITAMSAAFYAGLGKTVHICTGNNNVLVNEAAKFSRFYNYTGIEAEIIKQDSSAKNYKRGGVNIASLDEFIFFKMNCLQEMSQQEYNSMFNPNKNMLIMDEIDKNVLDDYLIYQNVDVVSGFKQEYSREKLVAIVYKCATSSPPKFRDHTNHNKFNITQIKKLLLSEFSEEENLKAIIESWDKRFWKILLGSALAAANKIENEDFVIEDNQDIPQTSGKLEKVAHPYNKVSGYINRSAHFTCLTQLFLHYRLNKKHKDLHFHIPRLSYPTFSTTASHFIKSGYNSILGLTGTASSNQIESTYLKNLHGMSICKFGSHWKSKRKQNARVLQEITKST